MVNITKLAQGIGYWLLGFIIIVLTNWIIPPIQNAMDAIFQSNEISSIIWFGAVILWLLAGVVMPIAKTYNAIMEEDNMQPIPKAIIAILIFVFGMLLTVKAWYMVTALNNLAIDLDGTANMFINTIYWIGLLGTWAMIVIATPFRMIMEAYKSAGY